MEDIFVQHREREPFENIKTGKKDMEIRLFDEKRQKIKIGQKIKVVLKEDESHFFFTQVIGLTRILNFESLKKVFGNKIQEYEWKILKRVYSEEQISKFGFLVIHFELA